MKKLIISYNKIGLKLFKYRFEGINLKINIFKECNDLSIQRLINTFIIIIFKKVNI